MLKDWLDKQLSKIDKTAKVWQKNGQQDDKQFEAEL